MLQRVFDLASKHGGIGPDKIVVAEEGLQLTERAASVQDSDCRLVIPI